VKTVKTFTNLAEAGFAASLLEAAGIPASIAGEQSFLYVAGIANEGVRLQVEDQDFDHAIQILREGLDAPPPPPASEPTAEEGRTPVALLVAVVAAYALLGFTIYQAREEQRTRPKRPDTQTVQYDYNGDGRPDHFYTYREGTLVRAEVDRNFDGKIDEWESSDPAGRPAHVEQDDNFDGRPDFWYFYENGQLVRSEQDVDYNGKPDWFNVYKYGVLVRSDCRPNGSQVVQRRLIYVNGILSEEWVDEDRDGKFDYKILHDPFGNTSERMPIEASH
jgi:hypothetical protein